MLQISRRNTAVDFDVRVKTAVVAAVLAGLCFLPVAVEKSAGYPRDIDLRPALSVFQSSSVAPIKFIVFAPQLDDYGVRSIFNTMDSPPADYSGLLRHFGLVRRTDDFRRSGVAPAAESTKHSSQPTTTALVNVRPRLAIDVDRIGVNVPTVAPMAFIRFCMKYARDCQIRRMAFRPRPVSLTSARKNELMVVNRNVNRVIVPQANERGVMAEEWLIAPREGDCNDYAVTKRHELLARGWPSRALLLAEAVIASGEHHLVLVVRTRENDFVLDNLSASIRPVAQVPYHWVRAQQEKNPKFWSNIYLTHGSQIALNAR